MSIFLANTLSPKDPEIRQHFVRCYEAMWRDLDRLSSLRDYNLLAAAARGWTVERIRALSVLNSFNRTVLGPFAACYGRRGTHSLGHSVPIVHGRQIRVDPTTAAPVLAMLAAFADIVASASIREHWLHLANLGDLVFALARTGDEDLEDGDDA